MNKKILLIILSIILMYLSVSYYFHLFPFSSSSTSCTPKCNQSGKCNYDDGCGGKCNSCTSKQICNDDGICVINPNPNPNAKALVGPWVYPYPNPDENDNAYGRKMSDMKEIAGWYYGSTVNTIFNLASGAVPGVNGQLGCANQQGDPHIYQQLPDEKELSSGFTNYILNFGGWGNLGNTPVKWNTHSFDILTSNDTKTFCNKTGYNGISLDIEGVEGKPEDFGNAINSYLEGCKGLIRIITLPGWGVNDQFGGMEWFKYVNPDNYEYVCMMFYNLSNDSETLYPSHTIKAKLEKIDWVKNVDVKKRILGASIVSANTGKQWVQDLMDLFQGGLTNWKIRNTAIWNNSILIDCYKQ